MLVIVKIWIVLGSVVILVFVFFNIILFEVFDLKYFFSCKLNS